MRSTLCFLGQGEGTGIDKAWIRDSQNNNMRNRILHGKCRLVPSYLAMIKPAPDGKFKRRQCSINGNEQGSAMGLDFFPGPLVWASPCCQHVLDGRLHFLSLLSGARNGFVWAVTHIYPTLRAASHTDAFSETRRLSQLQFLHPAKLQPQPNSCRLLKIVSK